VIYLRTTLLYYKFSTKYAGEQFFLENLSIFGEDTFAAYRAATLCSLKED